MAAGLVPTLVLSLLAAIEFAPLVQIRSLVFDAYQRTHPRTYRDAGVRVVDIDDESIRRLGQWPWPRTELATLVEAIAEAGAAAVVFDIVFSEPDRTSPARLVERIGRRRLTADQSAALASLPDHDFVFEEALAASPSVLGVFLTHDARPSPLAPKAGFAVAGSDPSASLAAFESAIGPLPQFASAAQGLGFVSIPRERDGVVRRPPMLATVNGQLFAALSIEALRVAQGAGAVVARSNDASGELGSGRIEMTALKVGEVEVPVTANGELWIYFTPPASQRVVPAWKILAATPPPSEMRRLFGGQIVFIGAGAVGLRDLVSTPMQDYELGVIVHAQATEQMILGEFLLRPDWSAGLEIAILLISGILLAMTLPRLGAVRGALLGGALVALTVGSSWYVFRHHHWLLDPVPTVVALTAAYMMVTLLDYVREERRRVHIHRAFDRYLSPELVKRIADDPGRLELGGEERQMTVLFCDIRGFSRLAEQMTPQEIIQFLVAMLTPLTDILLKRKATIDKYIGDAILAFWNAPLDDPDQYRHALSAAIEMSARLDRLNREMAGQDVVRWPGDVDIGIGLNAGPCCVGNMGSAQRLSYSLIGDTVNLASRIEGLTKQYAVRIAVGAELASRCPDFALIELDRVRVVGRERQETIYALVGGEAEARSEPFLRLRSEHDRLLADYRARRWDEAQLRIEGLTEAARFGLAEFYALFSARLRAYGKHPPPDDWDGAWVAARK